MNWKLKHRSLTHIPSVSGDDVLLIEVLPFTITLNCYLTLCLCVYRKWTEDAHEESPEDERLPPDENDPKHLAARRTHQTALHRELTNIKRKTLLKSAYKASHSFLVASSVLTAASSLSFHSKAPRCEQSPLCVYVRTMWVTWQLRSVQRKKRSGF